MITTAATPGTRAPGQAGTNPGRTHDTIAAYLDALRTGGDFGQYLSEDVRFTLMDSGETTRGRKAVVALIDYLHHGAFDATPEFAPPIVAGNRGMLEAVFVATHVGEFAGIAPANRQVRVPYTVAYDLAGGAITTVRVYLSMETLVRQLRDA